MVIATHGPFELRSNGAAATRPATFEEWQAATEWAKACEKGSPWWVGDLLALGEATYGEMYTQALDATGYKYQTLVNMKNVARSVQSNRRRETLSFAHHAEVAALLPEEQTAWLDLAEGQSLTVQQLRLRIRKAKADATGRQLEYWLEVKCDSVADREQLAAELQQQGYSVLVGGNP
jgi:hypothetical protein